MSKLKLSPSVLAFLCVQMTLYALIFTVGGDLVRYLCIVSAFVFSGYVILKNKVGYITFFSFCFTLAADLCLVMTEPREQLLGMIFFCGTQVLLALRIHGTYKSKRARCITLAIRVVLVIFVQALTLAVLGDKYDALSGVTMFYFANIVLSAVLAFVNFKSMKLFSFGMLCFVLCDVFVGLSSAAGAYLSFAEGSLLYTLANPAFDAAWMFYVPSQTLLSISTIYDNSHTEIKGGKICNL